MPEYCIKYFKETCFGHLLESPPKPENFQIKTSDNFHISAQNIDCV